MRPLKKTIDDAGGVPSVALACGKTPRAIYKWLAADALPRTEYTGETNYVMKIAELAAARGRPFDPAWLLIEAHPNKSAA
ncbi:helix-turn-helix domain-containing protein [Pseudomonas khavaziana]|uniref:helix-turn-helix domain-containing protein n=1 Tax=Pseudomonas khavaziana TaxID=2842351 RepID=UPI001C3E4128|nr:helix-turn-helix domain-containing protein [Pseudomonas khavaziana]MBV4478752.1 helix-turn-helix domain-containing protein [Pseudomonas khavaziana]